MERTFTARDLALRLDAGGYIVSAAVCGTEILKKPSPAVSLVRGGRLALPASAAETEEGVFTFSMDDGSRVLLDFREDGCCVTAEALDAPSDADALIFGPVRTVLDEGIGDVTGIVTGRGLSFGMMAGCRKTVEGYPPAFRALFEETNGYLPDDALGDTGRIQPPHLRAAAAVRGGGSVTQFWCADRTKETSGSVCGAEDMLILPMVPEDPDARIPGAKVLFFGCRPEDCLGRIGEIEIAEGLPHPLMEDGRWVKTAREAMKSYLISDFTKDDVDLALDKAALAGMDTLYHEDPFRTWGHFEWRESLAEDDADFRRNVSEKAAARGMKIGLHTLTNFTTTNDPYVTPQPSDHLVPMARVKLLRPLGPDDAEAFAEAHPCFRVIQSVNAVRAGNELFTFSGKEEAEDGVKLTGLVRGAFGTVREAHGAGTVLLPLRDHGYRTLFPDMELQDAFSGRLAELFNATGAAQISFDGLEGCDYTGQETYAPTRFVTDFLAKTDHFVLNDASRLTHYNWHAHTRMNWGEPWGEAMRTGQVETRIRNQTYFRRNLFPRMLGWFLLRTAERRFEASTREDLEWAMSEAAGFDAGFSMTVRTAVMKKLGNLDELLCLIRDWDRLRLADAFSEEQKARLRDPANEFRLEKQADGTFLLFPIHISAPRICSLGELQPGQPGGADWTADNPLEPSFAFRLRVDGDGAVTDPTFASACGTIRFPCTVEDGQYLLYDFDGTARVTDKNYNVLEAVIPEGTASLPRGDSSLSFTCGHGREETPDVIVRFLTRGKGEAPGNL